MLKTGNGLVVTGNETGTRKRRAERKRKSGFNQKRKREKKKSGRGGREDGPNCKKTTTSYQIRGLFDGQTDKQEKAKLLASGEKA